MRRRTGILLSITMLLTVSFAMESTAFPGQMTGFGNTAVAEGAASVQIPVLDDQYRPLKAE